MRFSLRNLLITITALSFSLAASQFHPGLQLCCVFVVIVPLSFLINEKMWRSVIYGGLSGILGLCVFAWGISLVLFARFQQRPTNATDAPHRLGSEQQFWEFLGPLIVPLGFLIGADLMAFWSCQTNIFHAKTERNA